MQLECAFKYREVQRWDVEMYYQWPSSRWQGYSTGEIDCPDVLRTSSPFEYVEYDDYKSGSKYTLLYKIQGITKDSGGSPLGNCVVHLHRTLDDSKVDSIVSDSAGNYLLYTPYITEAHYCVAYLNPNVTGATVNTLLPIA